MGVLSFRTMIIGALLIAFFSLALINFGIQFADDNNLNQSIMDDSRINRTFSTLTNQLAQGENVSRTQLNATQSEAAEKPEGVFFLVSVVGAGTKYATAVVGIFNTIFSFSTTVLGIHPMVFGVAVAILVIVVALVSWQLYKTGL